MLNPSVNPHSTMIREKNLISSVQNHVANLLLSEFIPWSSHTAITMATPKTHLRPTSDPLMHVLHFNPSNIHSPCQAKRLCRFLIYPQRGLTNTWVTQTWKKQPKVVNRSSSYLVLQDPPVASENHILADLVLQADFSPWEHLGGNECPNER